MIKFKIIRMNITRNWISLLLQSFWDCEREDPVQHLDWGLGWVGVEVARPAASHRSGFDLTSEFALIHESRKNGSIVSFLKTFLICRFIFLSIVVSIDF